MKVGRQSVDRIPASACVFCEEWERSLREVNPHIPKDESLVVIPVQFRHHVGAHMEQLALFAIPRGFDDDENTGSSGVPAGIGTNASSEKQRDSGSGASYEKENNPPLHVAAFEGLEAEVSQLLEEGADPNSRGETWGSALRAAALGGHEPVSRLLLNSGADSSAQTRDSRSVFESSAHRGQEVAVMTATIAVFSRGLSCRPNVQSPSTHPSR